MKSCHGIRPAGPASLARGGTSAATSRQSGPVMAQVHLGRSYDPISDGALKTRTLPPPSPA